MSIHSNFSYTKVINLIQVKTMSITAGKGEIKVPFPSEMWAKKYEELLNTSKDYEDSAKNWEGAMLFIIGPDGGATPFEIGVWLDLWHGKCRGHKFWYCDQEKPKADYIFSGPEKNWLSMIDGKIDPIQGLMTGKFKLVGNMSMVMRHTIAAKLLVQNLQKFEMDIVAADTKDPKAKVITFTDKAKAKIITVDRDKKLLNIMK